MPAPIGLHAGQAPAGGEDARAGEEQAEASGAGEHAGVGTWQRHGAGFHAGGVAVAAKAQQAALGSQAIGTGDMRDEAHTRFQRHRFAGVELAVGHGVASGFEGDAEAAVQRPEFGGRDPVLLCCGQSFAALPGGDAGGGEPEAGLRLAGGSLLQGGWKGERMAAGKRSMQARGFQRGGVVMLVDTDVGGQRQQRFEQWVFIFAGAACEAEVGDAEAARLRDAAQHGGEGCRVDAGVDQHAAAQRAGGDRGPGRHQRFAVAAGVGEQLVAAQDQDVERFDEEGGGRTCGHVSDP